MAYRYFAQTLPGFGPIAWQEIRLKITAEQAAFRLGGRRNDIVLFEYRGDPQRLWELRSTEDVFFLLQHIPSLSPGRAGLSQLLQEIRACPNLEAGLRIHRQLQRARTKRRTTFRVIVRKMGKHGFRRIDAQHAVEKGILQRYDYAWKLVPEGGDLEIWVNLLGAEVIVGLRLSSKAMRHRAYKSAHLPASLRPSAAFALALLSKPTADDVFLDPFCGAGTILIERALAGRYRLLLGGDIDPQAIAVVRDNIGPRYKPIGIVRWDAGRLPLSGESVDRIVSNPPFGRRVGSHRENVRLYRQFFAEVSRLLRHGGRLVLLTSETRLVQDNLAQHPDLVPAEYHEVSVLGRPATIYVLDRM